MNKAFSLKKRAFSSQKLAFSFKKIVLACAIIFSLTGCSFLSRNDSVPEPALTLADIQPAVMPSEVNQPIPALQLSDLVEVYEQVLNSPLDEATKSQIKYRLAGITTQRGEQALLTSNDSSEFFITAITSYEALLHRPELAQQHDKIRYQLAKAYEFDGNQDQAMSTLESLVRNHPNSTYATEAWFRLGDWYYTGAEYSRAQQAYQAVIDLEDTTYQLNSHYMLGWSYFKQQQFQQALPSFRYILDSFSVSTEAISSLDTSDSSLVEDSLRVMGLAFSNLDGANSLSLHFAAYPSQQMAPLLYQELADLYLNQERFRDSTVVYSSFVEEYPFHEQAPKFSQQLIDAYIAGEFPQDVRQAKVEFITRYQVNGAYWLQADNETQQTLTPALKETLSELSSYYHAQAQQLVAEQEQGPLAEEAQLTEEIQLAEETRVLFDKAAELYLMYAASFANDQATPGMIYLAAQANHESGDLLQAIELYEVMAYGHDDDDKAADAAYAAILLRQQLAESAADEQWHWATTDSQLRFSQVFGQDSRAINVLALSAQQLFDRSEYQQTITAAETLLNWQPLPEPEIQQTARLLFAHSAFALADYAQAERSYSQAISYLLTKGESPHELNESLAASIYQQGDLALKHEDKAQAVDHFLRVLAVAPQAEIRSTAQYDAATQLLAMSRWSEAIELLTDFRQRFAEDDLVESLPAKLILAYQESEDWQAAGEELNQLYLSGSEGGEKRENLWFAAESFQQAGNDAMAIDRYRHYAHTYHQPLGLAMEARFILSELYLKAGETSKREYWLDKMIVAHREAFPGTERSAYLAAFSQSELAVKNYQAYLQISLTLPLKSSLSKKQEALDSAINAYQLLLDYQLEEFTTEATFKIGAMYLHLGKALMDSERPSNLDALALQQYELLLEEQVYPFEDKAIEVQEANAQRSWTGLYDQWVQQSFQQLAELSPARYQKPELGVEISEQVH